MWFRCNRWLKWVLWLLLLLAVVYVWSGRLLAKVIPEQRSGIEYWLTQRLATPVSIGAIEVSGHLLAPNIVLRDIRVMSIDSEHTPLTMKLGWVGVDGLASLWHQQLRLRFLQLKGLNVQVWQTSQDQWRVGGFEALQQTLSKSSSMPKSSSANTQSMRVAGMQQTLQWLDSLIAQRGLVFDDINLQLVPNNLLSKNLLPRDPSPQWLKLLYGDVGSYAPLLPQNLWMQRLALHKQDQYYQLFSQITLLKNDPLRLTFSARIKGQSLAPDTWQAQAYLKLDNTDIKPWASAQLPAKITLDALQGQGEAWLSLQAGRLQRLHGRIELDQARWRYQWRGYRLDHWQGAFDFEYDHRAQWSLKAHPTTWHVGQRQTTLPAWRLSSQAQGNQSPTRQFQMAELNVAELHQLLNAVAQFDTLSPVPSVARLFAQQQVPLLVPRSIENGLLQLQQYAPKGKVQQLLWSQTPTEQTWQLSLADAALKANNFWPGFTGLHAQLQGKRSAEKNQSTQINLQIDSPQLIFDWPRVFRQPLPAARLKGQATLTVHPQQWQLQVQQMEAFNIDAIANGHALLTKVVNEVPLLKLQAQLRHVNAKAAAVYLPAKVMAPSLVTWLETAVLAGDIQQADFLYQGRLQKQAGALANNLLMRYQVANATIDYLPPWPRLEQAQGQVSIEGKKVQVNLQQGSVLGASVLPSQLTIDEVAQQLRLKLQADARGDAKTGLAILAQSPLQPVLSGLLGAVSGQGPIKVHLQLDAPLGKVLPDQQVRPLWANVRTQFDNATVELPLLKLTAQKFNGELTYDTSKGVNIPSWQASLFDQPLNGRTYTQVLSKKTRAIVTEFSGVMPLKPFNAWLQQPLLAYASGTAAFDAKLLLTPWQKMQGAFLQVDSDLNGVKVALPPPFGLDGKQTLGFRYRQQLDPQRPMMDVRYGSWVQVLKQKNALGIYFGDARPPLHAAHLPEGITVIGQLPTIDLQQWSQVLPERKKRNLGAAGAQTSAQSQPSANWSEQVLDLRSMDVSLSNLRWQDWELGSTRLKITPRQQDWLLSINSRNADLEAQVPTAFVRHWADQGVTPLTHVNTNHVIGMRIARLQLPLTSEIDHPQAVPLSLSAAVSGSMAGPKVVATPPPISAAPTVLADALPAMQLTVANLFQKGKRQGSLQTHIQPFAGGLIFEDLQASIKQVKLSGRGQWRWFPASAANNSVQLPASSQFAGRLATDNMLAFLDAWQYPAIIDAKTAQLNVDLTWPGNPTDFAIARLQGKLDVKMNNGRLLKVDNTTASVRVAGIMNFETIIRRMQLDFSDLFKKGLAFDEIKGDFVLANTQMHTDNFVLKGPAATFNVRGNADLLRQQLDQQLIVTLPVSRNLVLPAAATGGLPAAATAFLIEQAIGDRLDKLTELTFTMQGSWQDPKIEKR